MKRKVAAGVVLFLCLGAAGVYAANTNGYFKGYPKVNIQVNGASVQFPDIPAIMITDGEKSKTMMPIKEVAEALNGMVEWDGNTYTANIVKPNVHIILSQTSEFKEDDGRYLLKPFSIVRSGSSYSFVIYNEIDNLPKKEYLLKVSIENPSGTTIYTSEEQSNSTKNSILPSFIFRNQVNNLTFRDEGSYRVKVLMKRAGTNNDFVTVGEKTITAQ